MKKGSQNFKKILIIFGVAFVVYLLLAVTNYVPFPYLNHTVKYPDSTHLLDVTFNDVESFVSDPDLNTLNILDAFNKNINLEIYGLNERTIDDVFNWISNKMLNDGWISYTTKTDDGNGWEFCIGIWTKGVMISGHFIATGRKIIENTGYDIIIISVITDQSKIMQLIDDFK